MIFASIICTSIDNFGDSKDRLNKKYKTRPVKSKSSERKTLGPLDGTRTAKSETWIY